MLHRFDMLFNDSDECKNALAMNRNLTTEQIDLLYSTDVSGGIKNRLARFPKLTDEQFNQLFNDSDVNKNYLSQNPNLTTEQIDLLYSTEGVRQGFLLRHSKLTDEQFNRFFNNSHEDNLAYNPSINPLPINKWQSGLFNWSW